MHFSFANLHAGFQPGSVVVKADSETLGAAVLGGEGRYKDCADSN
jgi:hypothetical protein